MSLPVVLESESKWSPVLPWVTSAGTGSLGASRGSVSQGGLLRHRPPSLGTSLTYT